MNPYLSEAQLKNLLFALLSFSIMLVQSSLTVSTFLSFFLFKFILSYSLHPKWNFPSLHYSLSSPLLLFPPDPSLNFSSEYDRNPKDINKILYNKVQ